MQIEVPHPPAVRERALVPILRPWARICCGRFRARGPGSRREAGNHRQAEGAPMRRSSHLRPARTVAVALLAMLIGMAGTGIASTALAKTGGHKPAKSKKKKKTTGDRESVVS